MTRPPPKKSLVHRAFANQYNYILLAGAGLFALATFSWLPLLVGAGLETLWLALGADTSLFRRWVSIQDSKEERRAVEERAAAALAALDPHYVVRFRELEALGGEISQMAEENPSLETSLIQDEMNKLGRLLHSFLQMGLVHQRLAHYIGENSETEIQRDIKQYERALAVEKDREVQASLRQSLALAEKRMQQHAKITSAFKMVSLKMDILEKAFRYLRSHILGIGKREELSAEIDELILGVESVEELEAETSPLMDELGGARAARAVAAARPVKLR
ncbi:MAG TPA: hypothetical protein VK698_02355 [Kofleriaceae bacterium]|nr:hypothetical protein [Kofleriaceae bacterium]